MIVERTACIAGHFQRHLSRYIFALGLVAFVAGLLTLPAHTSQVAGEIAIDAGGVSDAALYRSIAERVANGESYYVAAAAEHRNGGYPLYPFVTVRSPLLASVAALLGRDGLHWLGLALVVLGAGAWAVRFHRARFHAAEVVVAFALYTAGLFFFVATRDPFHEIWAGCLVGIGCAFYAKQRFFLTISMLTLAAIVRDLAVVALAAGLALAIVQRDWRQAVWWLGSMAMVAVFYGWHFSMVEQVRLSGDLASQGWVGWLGPGFAFVGATKFSILRIWEPFIGGAFAIAALWGWSVAGPGGKLIAGFGAAVFLLASVAARPNNPYWIIMVWPWLLAGLAFLPRFVLAVISGPQTKGAASM